MATIQSPTALARSYNACRSVVQRVNSVCFECTGRCVHVDTYQRYYSTASLHIPSVVRLARRVFIERMFVQRAINNNVGERDERPIVRQLLTPRATIMRRRRHPVVASTIQTYSDLCRDVLK